MPCLDMYHMREPVEWLDDIEKAKVSAIRWHSAQLAQLAGSVGLQPAKVACWNAASLVHAPGSKSSPSVTQTAHAAVQRA